MTVTMMGWECRQIKHVVSPSRAVIDDACGLIFMIMQRPHEASTSLQLIFIAAWAIFHRSVECLIIHQ